VYSYSVLRKVVFSEKTNFQRESSVYTFFVGMKSTKKEIKRALEVCYDVRVSSVRTMICRRKSKRYRNRVDYRLPKRKKAIIRLKAGCSLSIFEDK